MMEWKSEFKLYPTSTKGCYYEQVLCVEVILILRCVSSYMANVYVEKAGKLEEFKE